MTTEALADVETADAVSNRDLLLRPPRDHFRRHLGQLGFGHFRVGVVFEHLHPVRLATGTGIGADDPGEYAQRPIRRGLHPRRRAHQRQSAHE